MPGARDREWLSAGRGTVSEGLAWYRASGSEFLTAALCSSRELGPGPLVGTALPVRLSTFSMGQEGDLGQVKG